MWSWARHHPPQPQFPALYKNTAFEKAVVQTKQTPVKVPSAAQGRCSPPSFQRGFCEETWRQDFKHSLFKVGSLSSLHGGSITTGLGLRASVYEINELLSRNHRTFLIFDLLRSFTGSSEPRNFSCPTQLPLPQSLHEQHCSDFFCSWSWEGASPPEAAKSPGLSPEAWLGAQKSRDPGRHSPARGRQTSSAGLGFGPSLLRLFPSCSQNCLYSKDGERAKASVGS